MTYIIDAHQDLAFNSFVLKRDYRRSVAETRKLDPFTGEQAKMLGQTTLGYPEFQRGQIALIIATLFIAPRRYNEGFTEQSYGDFNEAHRLILQQIDFYKRWAQDNPTMFRVITDRAGLEAHLKEWETPAYLPGHAEEDGKPAVTHPVGLVMSIEGAEGIGSLAQFDEYYECGVRLVGPVWMGGRLCGGTREGGGFTDEGYAVLDKLASLGYTADIAHMNEKSALTALDRYEGNIIASHANARALVKGDSGERHLTDPTLRRLIERDGVVGLLPFNRFLDATWQRGDSRHAVTLETLVAHVDHICQLAGDSRHVGIGSDFDGGFGYPDIPEEMNDISDLQLISPMLLERGYTEGDVENIFNRNWRRILERTLPSA